MTRARNFLSFEEARHHFDYDPETGALMAKSRGLPVGTDNGKSFRFGFLGKSFAVHNIIWVWMTGSRPKNEVDHANRDWTDNRWCNLRDATRSQNQANTGLYRNNKAGIRGVHFVKDKRRRIGRWRAFISKSGKNHHLGYFADRELAAQAYALAAVQQHGEFSAVRCA